MQMAAAKVAEIPGLDEFVFPRTVHEGRTRHAHRLRSARTVEAIRHQRVVHSLALLVPCTIARRAPGRWYELQAEVLDGQLVTARHHDGPLHHVLELAHV